IEKFSPAPRVLGRAMTLLRDADADLNEISDLIKTDLALTTDIIRGANSAFYGLGERVSSLDRAVQKIGFRECIRLLNLSVAHNLSNNELSCYGIAAEDYWAESLFNGIFMEHVAKRTGSIDPDIAHTAGLLRYIGRLAINRCLIDVGSGLFWDGSSSLPSWELNQVGFTQAHAAGHLMKAWQFSEEITRSIEWQEFPEKAPEVDDLLSAMHFTSTVLPQAMGLSFASLPGEEAAADKVESDFMKRFNIDADATMELIESSRHSFTVINTKLYTGHAPK
ncbi:MAG: HDOD domain-containing protein, partial [Opitutaceae bacterium]